MSFLGFVFYYAHLFFGLLDNVVLFKTVAITFLLATVPLPIIAIVAAPFGASHLAASADMAGIQRACEAGQAAVPPLQILLPSELAPAPEICGDWPLKMVLR